MEVKRFYRPEIDGLRFIAFLMIFFDHTLISFIDNNSLIFSFYNSGFLNFGVDLFFILSSFLITKLLVMEFSSYKTIDIKSFLIRRSLRIYPLYFLAILIGALIFPIFLKHPSVFPYGSDDYLNNIIKINLIPHIFFFANNTMRYTGAINQYFSHLWTISIEEQFYIFWPFILFYFLTNSNYKKLIYFLTSALFLMLIMRFYHTTFLNSPHPIVYMGTSTRLDGFAIGAIIALKNESNYKNKTLPFQLVLALLILSIYFILPNPLTSISTSNIFSYTLIAIGFGLIIDTLISKEKSAINKFLGSKTLSYLGKISYGLYMFHVPVFLVIQQIDMTNLNKSYIPLASLTAHFIITFTFAFISYNIFEKPFLKMKMFFEKITTRAI